MEQAPGRAVAGLNIVTFESLIKRLSRHIGVRRPISRGLQTLWLREIADEGNYPSLKSSPEIPLSQTTLAELLNAINQLKTNGIGASQIRADSGDVAFPNLTADVLADFSAIYENYSERLGNEWGDWADARRAVANQLTTGRNRGNQLMRRAFPEVNLVIVEGVDVTAGADLAILEGIAKAPGLEMYITFDWDSQNDARFGHVPPSYTRFLNLGFRQAKDSENRSSYGAGHIQHFYRNLYRKIQGAQPSVKKLNLTDRITLLKARDRVKEVEAAAELIKSRALGERSLAPHRICLAYYNLKRYAPIIHEVFPLYGIPYTLDEGARLTTSPFAVAFFALLDKIDENFTSPLEDGLRSPYFVIENLAPLLVDCKFEAELRPSEFSNSVARLIQVLRVKQRILDQERTALREAYPFGIDREIGALHKVESLIVELVEFLISRHGDEQSHPLRSYIDWLKLMASQTTYHLKPRTDSGILALSLAQTRGLDFDTVILGGLIDGEFPDTFRQDAFLPLNQRRNASDVRREQRLLFFQALNLFRERLYLLVPERDDNVDLIQSPFIDELGRIADFSTEPKTSDVLFSPEHFLKYYGKHVWARLEGSDSSNTSLPFRKTNLTSAVRHSLPVVEHSVRVEKSRGITHHLPQYEGELSPELLSATGWKMLNNFRNHTYSVAKLETYGQCPFQYFSKCVLLPPKSGVHEDEYGPTSLGKGIKLHEILAAFYIQRRDKPPIAQCSDAEFEAAVQEITQIAQKFLSVYDADNLFWEIEMETIIGGKSKRGILPRFLDQEREREFAVEPRHFEVRFGHGSASNLEDRILSSSEPVRVGDVSLSGRVDRVDIGDGIFTIGDYKTGVNVPKIGAIREGRSLQLPIYLVVVQQLLNNLTLEDFQAVGGIYYILREDGKANLGIGDSEYNGIAFKAASNNLQLLPKSSNSQRCQASPDSDCEEETIQSVIERSVLYVSEYVSSISNGQFPLTPHDPKEVCRYCDFKRICRTGAIAEDDTEE